MGAGKHTDGATVLVVIMLGVIAPHQEVECLLIGVGDSEGEILSVPCFGK